MDVLQRKLLLKGFLQALKDGVRIRGFRSGGGLRVVRMEKADGALLGYGEAPHIEETLEHANQDYLEGHRSYAEQYGEHGIHQGVQIGSSDPTSVFDLWLLRGNAFDWWQEEQTAFFKLRGYISYEYGGEREYGRISYIGESGESNFWEALAIAFAALPERETV